MGVEEVLEDPPALVTGPGEEFGAVMLENIEGDEEGRCLRGQRGGGTAAGGSPALERFEGQPPCGVPDDEFAIEDQAVGQLLGGGDHVPEAVLDQGAAPGLEQHPAASPAATLRLPVHTWGCQQRTRARQAGLMPVDGPAPSLIVDRPPGGRGTQIMFL